MIITRVSLLLALLGAVALASESSVKDPVTYLGEHMLPKTDVVLVGTAGETRVLATGARLLRFTVTELLSGVETGKSVLLVAGSPDLLPAKGASAVVFLSRLGRGRYEPVGLVEAMGADAEVRIGTLRKYIAIENLPGAAAKRIALRNYLLDNLESKKSFLRWSAARELANFSRENGKYLEATHLARIRAVRAKSGQEAFLDFLDLALSRAGAPSVPSEKEKDDGLTGPKGPEFRELRRLIARWKKSPAKATERIEILNRVTRVWLKHSAPLLIDALDDESAAVRRLAALKVGEGEFAAAEPTLRLRLGLERDRDVLGALIHSLGILKSRPALPAILLFGKSDDLRRSVCFAAARIGGKLGTDWLESLFTTHNRETERDREVRELVEFLRSPAFERQEKALAEIRRRRLK